MSWKTIQDKKQTLNINEVKTPFELYYIIKLLLRGNTLLVANHAPIFLFRIIGLFTLITIFKIDTQAEKITHYLDSQDYHYSHKAIEEFCNTFGSNYKILQIILETATESDFD